MSAVRANAYIRLPRNLEGIEDGQQVDAALMVPVHEAEHALLVTGSHDPVLDYLADMLGREGINLLSTHVGSMGGLLALKKDVCHAAPTHLLALTGADNATYLQKYLPGTKIDLVCVAERQQGIVSKEGLTLNDLTGRQFINRKKVPAPAYCLTMSWGVGESTIHHSRVPARGNHPHCRCPCSEKRRSRCRYVRIQRSPGIRAPVRAGGNRAVRTGHQAGTYRRSPVSTLVKVIGSAEFKGILESLGGYDVKGPVFKDQFPEKQRRILVYM